MANQFELSIGIGRPPVQRSGAAEAVVRNPLAPAAPPVQHGEPQAAEPVLEALEVEAPSFVAAEIPAEPAPDAEE